MTHPRFPEARSKRNIQNNFPPFSPSLTSVREEPCVYPVEGLLRDQSGGALSLEAAVDALHLGNGEAARKKNKINMFV